MFAHLKRDKTSEIIRSDGQTMFDCWCRFEPALKFLAHYQGTVRPDWAIFWTLGNFLKPLATINLPQNPTFFGNFCKGVKIYHFSSEIIFGQLL